jgi:6-phosphogluconolactonase
MIESFATPEDLADAATRVVSMALRSGLADRGHATLVGTGGRSPELTYDRLSGAELDWGRVSVTLSDDRFVRDDDPASNARLVRERLLVGDAASARFVPLARPVPDPGLAAELADPEIHKLAPFDCLLLGMGEDGHIASLIPGDPDLALGMDPESSIFVRPVPAGLGTPPVARITLTLAALIQARSILVLISGDLKRQIIEAGSGLPIHDLLALARDRTRLFWTP